MPAKATETGTFVWQKKTVFLEDFGRFDHQIHWLGKVRLLGL